MLQLAALALGVIAPSAARWNTLTSAMCSAQPIPRSSSGLCPQWWPLAVPAAFGGGGVLVNSSRVDNAPLVLIEAWAARLPIVSTRSGGIPDIVADERNGLLVRLDDPQALADATLRVLREPGLAVRLADAGHEACVDYTWRRAGEGWRSVYAAVAASSSDRLGAAGS